MLEIPATVMENALAKAISALITKYEQLGMKATGKWADGLEAVADGNTGIIKGYHYTEQLVQGREPGKNPPIKPLEQWVTAKFGLTGKQATSMAFAVSNKIAKDGTTWYQKGGSDLLEILEDPEVINTFYTEIGRHLTIEITEELTRTLKTVEV